MGKIFFLINIVADLVIAIIFSIYYQKLSVSCLHILQLEVYDSDKYMKWVEKNRSMLGKKLKEEKTPLVWTDRAKRLYDTHKNILLLLVADAIIIEILFVKYTKIYYAAIVYLCILFVIYFKMPKIMKMSNNINRPREEKINMGFYNQAKDKIKDLKSKGLTVVGITGSFGKTSTKFMLETILKEKYNALTTPGSYNTPMGLSKVINNDLNESVEVFIAELGAEKIGEIEEVATLVQPTVGIITAIGPTHMHLFKTIENIQKTKYELIEALDEDGISIFNYDNDYVKPLADRERVKTIRYGIEKNDKLNVYAENIEVYERGSKFALHAGGESIECTTKVLGKHNISNLLAAASCALELGLTLEEIRRGIEKVEPVEHRLNLVDNGNGIIVIDDAFNSNPVGARAALDVLSNFKEGRKIVITPGMVELGDMEEEANYTFGKELAEVCDFVILVGKKRTLPIQKGLKGANFPEEGLFVAGTLSEATEILGHLSRPKDVVLFENDLPDNYSEE